MFRSLCIAGMVSASLLAETNKNVIVVTANRMNQSAHDTAGGVTVITSEQLASGAAATTVEALRRFGGVHFRSESDNPMQSEVVMRGFGENAHGRVLVLVDGVRLNSLEMLAPNWGRIPVQSIDRIEILHGAQTALYGNNAVAGVINIITKTGAAEPETSLSVSAGSDDTYATHLRTSGTLADTRYAADLDWQKSSGWRDNSQYELYDARANLSRDWSDKLANRLGLFYNWGRYGMPGGLTKAQMEADPRQTTTPDDLSATESWGLTHGLTGKTDDYGEFSLDGSLLRQLRSAEFHYSGFGTEDHTFNDYTTESITLSPKWLLDKEIAGFRNVSALGADFTLERLTYKKDGWYDYSGWGGLYSGYSTLTRFDSALYARDEFHFTDAWSLLFGLRGNTMDTRADLDSGTLKRSTTDWQTAGEAVLNFRPTARQKYYLKAARFYRYPFVDEIASYQYGAPAFDADLDPETGWLFEGGASVEVLKNLVYDLRLYHMAMQDEIMYYNWHNVNAPDTEHNGLETSLRWTPGGPWGNYGLTYQLEDAFFSDGQFKDNEIPLVPKHVATLDGEIPVACGVSLLAAMHYAAEQTTGNDFDNLGAYSVDTYTTFDAGVKYEPTFVKGLSLVFACNNVLDELYATKAYGNYYYPANGRTWCLTAKYTF